MNIRVLLVDDEPSTLRFLQHTIKTRCPGWEVCDMAENGLQALEKIDECVPDMIITDVRMPGMNGVELSEEVRRRRPFIRIAIISGYEDFAAAQSAIQLGVSSYLLKPVKPTQLTSMLSQAKREILQEKKKLAMELFSSAMSGVPPKEDKLRHCPPFDTFTAALVRCGPLPPRFSAGYYPGPQSATSYLKDNDYEGVWLLRGRDSRELLLLRAETFIQMPSLEQLAGKAAELLTQNGARTIVIHKPEFSISKAPAAVDAMIDAMDRNLVLGFPQTISSSATASSFDTATPVDTMLERRMKTLLTNESSERIKAEFDRLFSVWEAEKRSALLLERDVRRLVGIIASLTSASRRTPFPHEHQLDEVLLNSVTFQELADGVWNLVRQLVRNTGYTDSNPGSKAFFDNVLDYIEQNLSEQVSLRSLCNVIGISQTYMSRLFRKHTQLSFCEYLTRRRMKRAKEIMSEQPDLPLKTVSRLVGYKDQFYFSRVFRSVEGIPPSRYLNSESESSKDNESQLISGS